MKLVIDEHHADEVAAELRAAGHDAVTVSDRRITSLDDESLLEFDWALLTNNARGLMHIVDRRATRPGAEIGGLLVRVRSFDSV